ncbi:MAG: HAMP domain-containing protein, partial [Bosea sp. (in: a-proteobacteria)]|nr:HAMP domain-containing protein [Bosea sp. (in: a-proteobacteria)]
MKFSLRLKDLSIRTKIALPLVAIGIISIGTAIYAGREYARIQKTYSELIDQRATAILDSARSTLATSNILRDLYKAIAYPEYMKQNAMSLEDVRKGYDLALQQLVNAKISFPERHAEFDALSRAISDLKPKIDDVLGQGARDEDLAALSVMSELDRSFGAIIADAVKLNGEIKRQTQTDGLALDAEAKQLDLILLVLSFAGVLLGLLGAMLLARQSITRPLDTLKARMDDLTAGNYAVEIDGRNRRDEIGAMARAVQVFKENGLA